MKTVFYLLALCGIISSCSDKRQEEIIAHKPLNENKLVISLQNFNDSIVLTKPKTRSGWLRFLSVASADIAGSFELGKIGASLGSSFPGYGTVIGGAIGATIGAAGASYMADLATRTSISASDIVNSKELIQQAYCYVKENNLIEEYPTEEIAIALPTGYESSKEVGLLHNTILNSVAAPTNEEENEEIAYPFTAVENAVLYSTEYIDSYESVLLKVINSDTNKPIFVSEEGVSAEIINLFIEVFNQYPEDINDVNFIVNKYIEKIEASNLLSESEKKNIYDALSVAVFSFYHWSNAEAQIEPES